MSDGREEKEDREKRVERERKEDQEDRIVRYTPDEGEPERTDS